MSMEYCESCDMEIDTDYDSEGTYITTPAVLYGENPEPESTTFLCSICTEAAVIEFESMESAREDNDQARRRGEL